MKTGLIITGGRLDLTFAGQFLRENTIDCVIAVDGGLEKTRALHLVPNVIVGDFDSINPEILEEYRKNPSVLWEVHKPEKNETDTELAVNTAIKLGCRRLLILGATGGRLDHELSNLHLLKYCLDCQIEAYLFDSQNKIYLLQKEKSFHKKQIYGTYISFIPLTEQVRKITLQGFKYPLTNKNISIGAEAGLCISNELEEDQARIRFESGILICIESKDGICK